MFRARVFPFVVSLLFTLLAACSQLETPAELEPPSLTPLSFGSSGNDAGEDVAISAEIGAVFVTGSTNGSLDGPNRGGFDGFVRRYNRSGAVIWKRQFGSHQDDYSRGVTIDEDANVYVVGTTGEDAFVRKFNKHGASIWTRVFSIKGGHANTTEAQSVHTDKNGHLYVVGSNFFSSFVRKYTTSGSVVWTRLHHANFVAIGASSVRTDWRGNVYVGGTDVDDDFVLGYILKYDRSGRLLWSRSLAGNDSLTDLHVAGETLYVTGYTDSADLEKTDPNNAFIRKYTTSGSVLWSRRFGTPAPDRASGVSSDSKGNAYVTGYTYGSLAGENLDSADIFVRKYSSSGGVSWTKQFGTPASDTAGDIATLKGSSETYLIGTTYGNLGGTNHGGGDAFLVRLNAEGNRVWAR